MSTVTLLDGREVDVSSREWMDECRARQRHVDNMRRLSLHQRRDYLAAVARKEGELSESRLRERFLEDWEMRKAEREAMR